MGENKWVREDEEDKEERKCEDLDDIRSEKIKRKNVRKRQKSP